LHIPLISIDKKGLTLLEWSPFLLSYPIFLTSEFNTI
jgi:hypothetical protein